MTCAFLTVTHTKKRWSSLMSTLTSKRCGVRTCIIGARGLAQHMSDLWALWIRMLCQGGRAVQFPHWLASARLLLIDTSYSSKTEVDIPQSLTDTQTESWHTANDSVNGWMNRCRWLWTTRKKNTHCSKQTINKYSFLCPGLIHHGKNKK